MEKATKLLHLNNHFGDIMSQIGALKLVATKRPNQISAVQLRRNKICRRSHEQIMLARAQQEGKQFVVTKFRTSTDAATGTRSSVEVARTIKPRWFTSDNGKTAIAIRYGARVLELAKGKFAGIDNVLVSATGYTGAGGFEVYVDNKDAEKLWDAVFAAGEAYGIQPIGLGARDTLRLEMGFCLYGNDIDDTTSPIEAGLGWITKLRKGDFVVCQPLAEERACFFAAVETERHGYENIEEKLSGLGAKIRRVPG